MELDHDQPSETRELIDNAEDTIILTLPSQLEIEDGVTSSSLVRSECGQFYLITYDAADKVISKHQINIQISADDFLGIKCNNTIEQPNALSGDDLSLNTLSDELENQDGRSHAGITPL